MNYKDNYGYIWKRVHEDYVYNPALGYGVWDNGKGLTRI
jgi:hypothetical protein